MAKNFVVHGLLINDIDYSLIDEFDYSSIV